ncbi:hypothetical protein P3T18_005401 [Paraburkholderia sp. GAS199]|uniref:hypothetical protein n=1 Tax=Paraburkholderia sp. GAS199 TaxID=3035126 RepID=UPI003D24B7D0
MAKAKLTPEQWTEARREWESSPLTSYATVAAKFLISKALVGQRAAAENWQKAIGVDLHPSTNTAGGRVENLQERGRSGYVGRRLDSSIQALKGGTDVFAQPAAAEEGASDKTPSPSAYADEIYIPEGLDADEREEFVKAEIVGRQKAINARHLKELQATRGKVYAAIKRLEERDGAGGALAAQRIVAALLKLQEGEMITELERVRLSLGEFAGKPAGPRPCRIVVHMQPGKSIGSGVKAIYGSNAVVVDGETT